MMTEIVCAGIGFLTVTGFFLFLWHTTPKHFQPVDRETQEKIDKGNEVAKTIYTDKLQRLSYRGQNGTAVETRAEGVTYLDSARVSKELRDALKRSGRG